jgi:hypothetical protein
MRNPRERDYKDKFHFFIFRALVTGSLKPQKYNLSSFMPEVSNTKYMCVLWSNLLALIIMNMNPQAEAEEEGVSVPASTYINLWSLIYVNWY